MMQVSRTFSGLRVFKRQLLLPRGTERNSSDLSPRVRMRW